MKNRRKNNTSSYTEVTKYQDDGCREAKMHRGIVCFVERCFCEIRQNRPVTLNSIQHLSMPIDLINIDRLRVEPAMTGRLFSMDARELVPYAKQTEKHLFSYSPINLFTSKKAAFTLAEVLITLGIIGVVAALTLPSVITNIRNKELKTGLKKAYSTISQALLLYENDNGEPVTAKLEALQLKPILMKYIKTAKDCGFGAADYDKACMPNKAYVSDPDNYKDIYKNFNGKNNISYAYFDDGQFVINDGMFVMLENSYLQRYADRTTPQVFISVDVNGFNKKPNRLGQDLFMFQVTEDGKFLPMGAKETKYYSETDNYCSADGTSGLNGAGCTAKALSDENFWKSMPR